MPILLIWALLPVANSCNTVLILITPASGSGSGSGACCQPAYTTGNSNAAEGFCFAEGRISGTRQRTSLPRANPRQRVTFGKSFFAEGRALGRETPSVKAHLCRGLGPRQRMGARRCGPRVTVALGVRLCRVPVVKPSAKLYRRSGFAEGPPACPRQLPSLPRVWSGPSANFFLFFRIYVFFSFCGTPTLFLGTC